VAWTEADLFTTCHLDLYSRLATVYMGGKLVGGFAPFAERGAGSPSNTMSPGLRPSFLPSDVLVQPDVWPQQTWTEN